MWWLRAVCTVAVTVAATAKASKLTDAIYTALDANNNGVSRLLNEDGMIGSNSGRDGDVGILYKIERLDDLNALKVAPDRDYIALIDNNIFGKWVAKGGTHPMRQLQQMSKVKGALIYTSSGSLPLPFSAGNKVPNANNGHRPESTIEWNTYGGGFCAQNDDSCTADASAAQTGMHWTDIGMPFFILSAHDTKTVMEKFATSNNAAADQNTADYPLLGAKLQFFQWAAKDATTCMRKQDGGLLEMGHGFPFCQPIGGQTVLGYGKPYRSSNAMENKMGDVMVAVATDAVSTVHPKSFGADADALAVVTLLAAAGVVGQLSKTQRLGLERNLIFAFFTGEKWGYIGSSAYAHDMQVASKKFKDLFGGGSDEINGALEMNNIDYYIELDQLLVDDLGAAQLYLHRDNVTNADNLKTLFSNLQTAQSTSGGGVISAFSESASEMPPSSYRGLFVSDEDNTCTKPLCPGTTLTKANTGAYVISAYDKEYKNEFFETYQDSGANVLNINNTTDNDELVIYLTNLATVVAQAALLTAGGAPDDLSSFKAEEAYVRQLIRTITFDQTSPDSGNAPRIRNDIAYSNGTSYGLYGSAYAEPTSPAEPIDRYVSVFTPNKPPAGFSSYVYRELQRQLMLPTVNACQKNKHSCCPKSTFAIPQGTDTKMHWNTVTLQDSNGTKDVACGNTTAFYIDAPSPAFSADGSTLLPKDHSKRTSYDPHRRWSTWTESTWDTEDLQIFLIGDPASDTGAVAGGVVYLLVCMGAVYLFNKKVEHIEADQPGISMQRTNYANNNDE